MLLGALTLAAVPAGIMLGSRVISVDLTRATVGAVAACFVLGIVGVSVSRRARYRIERSLARQGERTFRIGRFLLISGLYIGLIGAIALGFYGVVVLLD